MAMEKAIIATPTDGTCELIQNGKNGLIIPFDDTQALADAMITLAESKEKCKQYGISARSLIEKSFNARHVSEDVAQIYNRLVLWNIRID